MTLQEAEAITRIIREADGGCPGCVEHLVELARVEFPEFDWQLPGGSSDVTVRHAG